MVLPNGKGVVNVKHLGSFLGYAAPIFKSYPGLPRRFLDENEKNYVYKTKQVTQESSGNRIMVVSKHDMLNIINNKRADYRRRKTDNDSEAVSFCFCPPSRENDGRRLLFPLSVHTRQ